MKVHRVLCSFLLLLASGCSSVTVEDYADNKPTLDIRTFLNGNIDAWGMFVDNSGKAEPMFQVKLNGAWRGNDGILKEHFIYSDGHTQDREWKISFTDDRHFTGTAADVIGTATGEQEGNAAQLKYVLTVETEGGDSHDMSMNDWLYQMNDHLLINRNEMSKFGIKVGELIISFDKQKK